ncbi:hypothetical protein GALMADRAFT_234020 [Galerina marginata CBS 339.88]|uniref:Uncharacterized protein n=1 Tax=Galerina marginata (strain CBS 339.88) TaxID=685588 RepID=A0A067U1N3_GALM3|nr:hypothetical protein GALMADRAFT_234020 [Galerina marginata CBS 339.88]
MSGTSRESSPSNRIHSSNAASSGEDRAATQRSLQHASVALEVAYNRIRQVRRNLLQVSESLPNSEALPRSTVEYNEVRPGHDALVLSGGDSEESEVDAELFGTSGRLLSVPPLPHSISMTEESTTFADSGNSPGATHGLPSITNSLEPPSLFRPSVGTVRPPRQPTRQQLSPGDVPFFSRRGSNQDSASTARGLRVAAREANAQDPTADFLAYAADLDRILVRASGPQPGSSMTSAISNIRTERQNGLQRYADSRDAQRATPAPTGVLPSSTTSWRSPDPRRWRMRPEVRPDALQFSIEASDRIQSILNPPVTTQSSSDIPRAPLAPEPGTTPLPGNTPAVAPSLYRRYHEALQSDNMASNVNIDWSDEEFISWLFPAQDHPLQPSRDFPSLVPQQNNRPQNPDAVRITRTTDTAVSPPENSLPRRGWARLDPDGDEISSNEEEELERSRTEYRLRALHRARQIAAAQNNDMRSEYPYGGLYRDYNGQRTLYGSVLDSTMTVQGRRHFSNLDEGNSIPLHVDPLPMPLVSMVTTPECPPDDIYVEIDVPKLACLAGR